MAKNGPRKKRSDMVTDYPSIYLAQVVIAVVVAVALVMVMV